MTGKVFRGIFLMLAVAIIAGAVHGGDQEGVALQGLSPAETVVYRYFKEVLDEGETDLIESLFHEGVIVHRADAPGPLQGREAVERIVQMRKTLFSSFKTTIHDLFSEGDKVVARISHEVVPIDKMPTRVGLVDAAGKLIEWDAIAIFRFDNGVIAEEWVSRDELGVLIQLGAVEMARPR